MTKIMDGSEFRRLCDKIINDVSEFIEDDIIASISYCRSIYNKLMNT